MKYLFPLLFFSIITAFSATAQRDLRSFIFGHSLINHEFQVNPTPSQETSVPHWLQLLAQEAGNTYAVSGQYGFLPQHANLPPIAQWGFDIVPPAWDSDYEPFSAAEFTSILITPANFIQWQGPAEQYPTDNSTPIDATTAVFDWCQEQENDLSFYIYENWPDMAPYLTNGFPPSQSEWEAYNSYLQGDFHNWFLDYYEAVSEQFPGICLRMIPVGPIIGKLLQQAPFNQIPITDLYEDDAPHGRPTIYFLAALTTYMSMYEEKAPANFQVAPIINSIIQENYSTVVDFIWTELNNYETASGTDLVFCNLYVTNTSTTPWRTPIELYPNPSSGLINLEGNLENHSFAIFNTLGEKVWSKPFTGKSLDISRLSPGLYYLIVRDASSQLLYQKVLIKE